MGVSAPSLHRVYRLSDNLVSGTPSLHTLIFYLFFYTCFTIFSWVPSISASCGVLYHPSSHKPTSFYSSGPVRLSLTFLWNVECTCTYGKRLPTNKEIFRLCHSEWSYEDSLGQGSRMQHKGAVSCKTTESTCDTVVVGQFNWRRWWWTKKSKKVVWPISISNCSCVFYKP